MAFLASLGAAIGGASGLFGSAMDLWSQSRANRANKAMFDAQLDFADKMSRTAHQREVSDLRAAGLNPILSAGGSGAHALSVSPVAAQATKIASALQSGVSAAKESALLSAELKNKKANTDVQSEHARLLRVQQYTTAINSAAGLVGTIAGAKIVPSVLKQFFSKPIFKGGR